MFGGRELKNLELRRRELVLQSTLNRLAMKVELQNLRTALEPADRIVNTVRAVRPWLMLLAPLAGLFAARGLRGNGSGFSKMTGLLKWLQALLGLWKQINSLSNNGAPETSPATPAPDARM